MYGNGILTALLLLHAAFTDGSSSTSSTLNWKSVWNAGFDLEFCATSDVDRLNGWILDIQFDIAVETVDVWDGIWDKSTSGTTIVTLSNKSYNKVWHAGEKKCITIVGHTFAKSNKQINITFRGGPTSGSGQVTPAPSGTTRSPSGGNTPPSGGSGADGIAKMYTTVFKGEATYYGGTTGGSCSYKNQLPYAGSNSAIDFQVALNKPQYNGSLTCGMCLKVTGSGQGLGNSPVIGTYTAFVDNICPECHEGDVDLGMSGDGRWDVTIQAVQCPVGSTVIQYAFAGSNNYYVKLQIRNARIPITYVRLQQQGQWVEPTRSPDGYWIYTSGQWQTGEIPIRMVAANGEFLTDRIPGIDTTNDNPKDGLDRVQVSKDPNLPSA